jgi:hypothetical protein
VERSARVNARSCVARYLPKSTLSEWQIMGFPYLHTFWAYACMHACMRKPIQQQGRDVNTRKRRILGRPRIPPSSFQGSMDGVLRGPGKESERCGKRRRKRGEKTSDRVGEGCPWRRRIGATRGLVVPTRKLKLN